MDKDILEGKGKKAEFKLDLDGETSSCVTMGVLTRPGVARLPSALYELLMQSDILSGTLTYEGKTEELKKAWLFGLARDDCKSCILHYDIKDVPPLSSLDEIVPDEIVNERACVGQAIDPIVNADVQDIGCKTVKEDAMLPKLTEILAGTVAGVLGLVIAIRVFARVAQDASTLYQSLFALVISVAVIATVGGVLLKWQKRRIRLQVLQESVEESTGGF